MTHGLGYAMYVAAIAGGVYFIWCAVTQAKLQRANGAKMLLGVMLIIWSVMSVILSVDKHDRRLSIKTVDLMLRLRICTAGYCLGAGATLLLTRSFSAKQ